jgi:signal transduction histidine kinase
MNAPRAVVKSLRPRQLLLFAVVVTLPVAAVFIQGFRISRYEAELAESRQVKARATIARDIGGLVVGTLDQIRFAEAARTADSSTPIPGSYASDAVALIGVEVDGQLVWPWDPGSGITRHGAASVASTLAQARSAAPAAARRTYAEVLQLPSEIADEYGVPFWTYAALALLHSPTKESPAPVLARMAAEFATQRPLPGKTGAQLRNLLAVAQQVAGPELRSRVDELDSLAGQRNRELQDLLRVQASYSSMGVNETGWKAFPGNVLWLIGKAQRGERKAPLVLAVRADAMQERVNGLSEADRGFVLSAEQGELMDERLAGLRVMVPEDDPALSEAGLTGPSFYGVTIALALAVSMFGAYFLWRDTRRESALVQLRSQFVSGVSHELKTPLTSIRMFADTLQIAEETGADDPAKRIEYLNIIVQESERLTRLLNNVLAFAQIERGSQSYEKQAVRLQDILEDAARIMRFPLEEKGFALELDFADDVPAVQADRDAIEQAVLNLLSNAMKYSGKNRYVALRLCRQQDNAVISVMDHGIGIPLAAQDRIFESFYRVPGKQAQAVGGAGLGLAIVDHIVRAHDGTVTVQSEPDRGSTFSIRIPLGGGQSS